MNWDHIGGKNWQHHSGHVKAQWSKLSGDDIKEIDGDRAELEGKIHARYGYAKDQVKKDVDRWLAETEFTTPPPKDGGARYADRAAFEQGDKK